MATQPKTEICISLSGQMRNYEPGLPWLHSNTDPISYSVVIATWSNRGGKLLAGNRRRLAEVLPDGLADVLPLHWVSPRLFDLFPSLTEVAERRANERTVTVDDLLRVYPGAIVHIEDALRFRDFERQQLERHQGWSPDPFSLSMLYKVWQADVLRLNAEVQLERRFDFIIRARPDFPFMQPTVEFLRGVDDTEIYVDRVSVRDNSVGDGFALGKPEAMAVYSRFFLTALEKVRNGKWSYIHSDLYHYLVAAGLTIRTYPMLGYNPDRLLTASEVVEAVQNGEMSEGDPLSVDRRVVAGSAAVMVAVRRGEIDLGSSAFLKQFDERLDGYDPAQDSGFFYATSFLLISNNEALAALLCLAISAIALRTVDFEKFRFQRGDVEEDYFERCVEVLSKLTPLPDNILDDDFLLTEVAATGRLGAPGNYIVSRILESQRLAELLNEQARYLMRLVVRNPARCAWLSEQKSNGDCSVWVEKTLRCGLASNPGNPELLATLAAHEARQGRIPEANYHAAQALAAKTSHSSFLAGQVFVSTRQLDLAEASFRQAIELHPVNPDYYMLLSGVLLDLGRGDEAVTFAAEAAARSPFPLAHRHNHLGHTLRRMGKLVEAEQAFSEAFRRDPNWRDVQLQIEDIRLQLAKSAI